MRRLKLSYQITIIFLVAFIITSVLIGILITRRLDNVYEENVYDRLETFGKAIRLARDISTYEVSESIGFISYNSKDKSFQTSGNIAQFADDDAVKLLIGKAVGQTSYIKRYENTINNQIIYYSILNYQGFFGIQNHDVFVILTDESIKAQMVRTTTRQVVIACIIAFVLGYLVVILWITKLVNDTKKISGSLKNMGENHYETQVVTPRKDEIGELVASIEHMRKMIIDNEQSKQEVIQGVSHDLKTPIAIISSYIEALEDGMCTKKEAASIISIQCSRLETKVTQLLNLTRLGYIDVNDKTVGSTDMKKMVEEVVQLYSYQTDVKVNQNLANAQFFGDKESWMIALQNILDNAVRYAKTNITITLKKNMLAISNDGKPIEKDILPTIFSTYKKGAD
ncbi:MAG: HAMP domain-containing histidine kinase, partial [Clostridiales bacterium]|nr:HAMP domain-containing histidine kinase [Clostridiales bacterium]